MKQELHNRMISRASYLSTQLDRLLELEPRLLAALPDTVGGCAERLGATRCEIEDAAEFALDQIANRGGRLVQRNAALSRQDRADPFYAARSK